MTMKRLVTIFERFQRSAFVVVLFGPAYLIAEAVYQFLPASFGELLSYMVAGLVFVVVYAVVMTVAFFARPSLPGNVKSALYALKLANDVSDNLTESLVQVSDDETAAKHCLDSEGVPSPLSSAYLLRAFLATPTVHNSAPILGLVNFIHANRAGGGWKATSQSQARPEVTADVLIAIRAVSGESPPYLKGLKSLVKSVERDALALEPTYAATTVLTCLAMSSSTPGEVISSLSKQILNGFIPKEDGQGYWAATLGVERNKQVASVASTARCLIALGHIQGIANDTIRDTCQAGIKWLASQSGFANETSEITRNLNGKETELLVNHHFTAALTTIAACVWKDLSGANDLGDRAILEIGDYFDDGFWRWSDGCSAVWMNLQGITAATLYSQSLSERS